MIGSQSEFLKIVIKNKNLKFEIKNCGVENIYEISHTEALKFEQHQNEAF